MVFVCIHSRLSLADTAQPSLARKCHECFWGARAPRVLLGAPRPKLAPAAFTTLSVLLTPNPSARRRREHARALVLPMTCEISGLGWIFLVLLLASCPAGFSQTFRFPTANHALLESGGEERFFVGTVGKPWSSGMFGCVRTDGRQFHEGIDIRCLERDRHGEPADPVLASADGTVAYVNDKPGLSNYGRYIVVKHHIEGLEIFSVYAHLREAGSDIEPGRPVRVGEKIGIMGRSTNTREGISRDRAHVHFELNLLVNDRFDAWHRKNSGGQRNDHGDWNGHNLLGIDPSMIFRAQERGKGQFRLLDFLRGQTELCRVVVRATSFSWLHRYTPLIRRSAKAEQEGVAGYELALNYVGIPFQLIPRSTSEISGSTKIQLLSVNEAEQARHPCRRLVIKRGSDWQLTEAGVRLLDQLVF